MNQLFQPHLQTTRISYYLVNQRVYDSLFSGEYSDVEIMKFFGFADPLEVSLEKERYLAGLSTYNRTFSYFFLKEIDTDRLLGQIGFHTLAPLHHRGELFYSIKSASHRRQGYMNEAFPLVINFGFNELDLNRIEAITGSENIASVSLLQKFGFVYEGLLREHYKAGDNIEDSLMFSLLKSENPFDLDFGLDQ